MRERNIRQCFLGTNSEKILSGTRAAILGNCGGGSHIAQQLAHVGIGKFLLIDPDITKEPNLNRMIGSTPADAAALCLKTEVLTRLIKSVNPDAEVISLNSKWQSCAEHLRNCDIVFGCVDDYTTRSELEAYCRRFMLPYIDIGMDVNEFSNEYLVTGQIITSMPGQACMWCMGFLTQELLAREAARYGDAGHRPQVVWPNGVLASIAVGNAMRLLAPWNREPICPYIVYDGNRQTVKPSSRLVHIDTLICHHFPVDQVGDPLWGVG